MYKYVLYIENHCCEWEIESSVMDGYMLYEMPHIDVLGNLKTPKNPTNNLTVI